MEKNILGPFPFPQNNVHASHHSEVARLDFAWMIGQGLDGVKARGEPYFSIFYILAYEQQPKPGDSVGSDNLEAWDL